MATMAGHVWRPSSSRVLVLDGFVPGPRGVPLQSSPPLQWPAKDPNDVLDYQLDISPALYGNPGDVIATLDVMITPSDLGDLAIVSTIADGTRAIVWLQGGKVGVTYNVTLTVGTDAGRTLSRSILLPVVALTATSGLSLPLTTETGSTLVDGAGDAIVFSTGAA